MSKRIVTFFLCVATVFSSLFGTALAARPSGEDLIQDTASVVAWNAWLDSNLYMQVDFVADKPQFWDEFDHAIQASGAGACSDNNSLWSARDNWSGSYTTIMNPLGSLWYRLFALVFTGDAIRPIAEVAFDSALGVYRLREVHTKLWIVNSSGHFPYYRPDNVEAVERIGQWIHDDAIKTDSALWHTVIGADLSAYIETWPDRSCKIEDRGDYYWIVWVDSSSRPSKRMILCDDYGYPYYVPKPKQTAVTTPNNYYTEPGDSYTDDSTNVNVYDQGSAFLDSILDVENGILNVGGEAYYADQVTYDDSTKTYYVDSHDQYVWNPVTNNYTTNNYKWEIQYNIDYTSVTYIGQTEEYEERYEYYYELPDGRSSADLTVEDLEQLSMVFSDVMLYARTADDLDMRALYHFDGNTEDSSYWSYTRHGFEWNTGASLTYMDEGTFGGSLYLDETEHDFSIALPGNDAAGDWTLQFRYYQSHTETPVADSWLSFGNQRLLYFTGAEYLAPDQTPVTDTSVGSWNELCIVRHTFGGSRLSFYVNGVCVRTVAYPEYCSPVITFHFGSEQQTYKKIDELRFTERALFEETENYTPSVVPYDTNLSLVLPDTATAIADEIVTYRKSAANKLTAPGLDDFEGAWNNRVTNFQPWPGDYNFNFGWPKPVSDIALFYDANNVWSSADDTGTVWYHTSASGPVVTTTMPDPSDRSRTVEQRKLGATLFLPVYMSQQSNPLNFIPSDANRVFGEQGRVYTLSVLLSDGTYSEITFDYNLNIISSNCSGSNVRLSREYIGTQGYHSLYGYDESAYAYYCGIAVYPASGDQLDIIHVELVEGEGHQFAATVEQAVYSSEQLTESPVLAVRSNRPIALYQIGGVRPSYPEEGQVYAMVENNRITSLQQYTGFVWESVDGRIWTGSRWIPYSSFDVKTLQDLYDAVGSTDDDYFYSESGFWSWFQKQWKVFMDKLDQVIYYLKESGGFGEESDCQHVYKAEDTPATCNMPGKTVYTCENCGDILVESVPALGHDWVVIKDVETYSDYPENLRCPACYWYDYSMSYYAERPQACCRCTRCQHEWDVDPVTYSGYTVSRCSRCGVEQTQTDDSADNGLFTALGNFLSDGILWILDKLTALLDSLSGVVDIFSEFVGLAPGVGGSYPSFLAEAIGVLPEDFLLVVYFGVVAFAIVAIIKKLLG